jgi:hypothetical protein
MTRRGMDWRRARLHGKPVLDHRYEFDPDFYADRASRWLRAVERNQQRRLTTPSSAATAMRSSR